MTLCSVCLRRLSTLLKSPINIPSTLPPGLRRRLPTQRSPRRPPPPQPVHAGPLPAFPMSRPLATNSLRRPALRLRLRQCGHGISSSLPPTENAVMAAFSCRRRVMFGVAGIREGTSAQQTERAHRSMPKFRCAPAGGSSTRPPSGMKNPDPSQRPTAGHQESCGSPGTPSQRTRPYKAPRLVS